MGLLATGDRCPSCYIIKKWPSIGDESFTEVVNTRMRAHYMSYDTHFIQTDMISSKI